MKLLWSEQSMQALKNVFEFYKKNAGDEVALRIRNQIIGGALQLLDHSEMGQVEPLLDHKKQGHRSLIKGHCKIIYMIIDDDILITDVFDTRQDPGKSEKEL